MYQRIGFQCFAETMFEDAGKYLFNGDLDPRLLISYYPKLRGSLFTANDVMNVFAGVAEHMPQEKSVHDISKSIYFLSFPPLQLIFSCIEPSQELFASSCTQHEICTSHSRAEEDTGYGCPGDAHVVPPKKPNEKERRKRYGSRKYGSSN